MDRPIYIADAFAEAPFEGNPAGVCVLSEPASEGWMRSVAAELNLSETAFVHPEGDAWRLRWFTPATEVDLCGHATLATAHVLWTEQAVPPDRTLRFDTLSGRLEAERTDDGRIAMDFPAEPVIPEVPPQELLRALAPQAPPLRPVDAGRNRMDWLIELENEAAVRSVAPDYRALAAVDLRGVMITSAPGPATEEAHPAADFVSRFFAPACGVDEDPVTGSAHCALGPWWARKLGRATVEGRQVSRRGGTVGVEDRGSRVTLHGRAVTVVRGTVRFEPTTDGGPA